MENLIIKTVQESNKRLDDVLKDLTEIRDALKNINESFNNEPS